MKQGAREVRQGKRGHRRLCYQGDSHCRILQGKLCFQVSHLRQGVWTFVHLFPSVLIESCS